MPDTPYLDSGLQTGFNDSELFQLKLENKNNFDRIMNQQPQLTGKFDFYQDPNAQARIDDTQKIIDDINLDKTNFTDYLTHPDKKVRDIANQMVYNKVEGDPFYKRNVGGVTVAPYDKSMDKFLSKDYGFRFDRDNEDFYYRNVYMQDGWFMRNIVKNPARFLGRVIVPAILKFGEGLGYVGSMLTSVGSDNYWADVADNGFSSWLEGLEQDYKDQVIPIYKQAGFDDKGFFSKLTDWSFWNDSVADGVAFMASAAIPGMGLAKLGAASKFGQAFSTATKAGKFASKVGMGSWAELSSWTFNTAMEASVEGAGVFKEMKRRLELDRAQGLNNLTDDDIKERAGSMAANTIAGNFAILGLSNAFENTLFFKPFKQVSGRAKVSLGDDFVAGSTMAGTGRLPFYGSRAAQGLVAEGLWEENAQLAIQRLNQGDTEGRNFFEQLGKQTLDAFSGDDKEAAESIGLGALIGIGASTVFSKVANERRKVIENTQKLIEDANMARHNLFSVTDIYERDDNGAVVFDNNVPRTDAKKLAVKQKELENLYGKFSLTNADEYFKSSQMQYQAKTGLADYVRSLANLGITGVSDKMRGINAQNATLFGMNPTDLKNQTKDFASLAQKFENISLTVDQLPEGRRPDNVTEIEFTTNEAQRRGVIYDKKTSSEILSGFISDESSKWLASLNQFRTLNNASLSQFPVDQLNTFIYQQRLNKEVMDSPAFKNMSDFEKQYHINREQVLANQIENYRKNNELALQDSKKSPNGYYIPVIKNEDGSITELKFDTQSLRSQEKIADYNNIVDKNGWISDQLSNEDGYENFLKLKDTPLSRSMKAAQQAPSKPEVIEEKPGDFDKILEYVKRTLFSENYTPTAETEALLQKYPELVAQLMSQYKDAAEKSRETVLNKKLESLRSLQQTIGNQVREVRNKLADRETELSTVQAILKMVGEKKVVNQKSLANSVNRINKDIEKYETWLNKNQNRIGDLDNQIAVLEQEIESGSLTGLRNALSELRQERDWVKGKVDEAKSLADRLKKLVQDIRRIAYKLFGSKSDFERNLEKGRWEAVGYANEIEQQKTAWQDAKDILIELNALAKDIEDRYNANKAELEEIINTTNQFFKDQYKIITGKASPENVEDSAIEKGLTGDKNLFPAGIESEGEIFEEEDGFDGANYQRPLHTKFYTTTFPWIGEGQPITNISQAPQDVQDHAAFLDYLTSPFNAGEVKKKLGKGKLLSLTVTRNNVEALGLQEVLAERKKYFEVEDPALTHIEVIPVIEEGGYLYFVDKELNKLGKVGEEKPTNMVRRSLRTAKFTDAEQAQYAVKYSQDDMNSAVKDATDWRTKILEITKKEPQHAYEFAVTRGIPNKMRMEDGKPAQNVVVDTILPKNAVNGQTVRVYSTDIQPIINGDKIEVPAGRPFIYTKTDNHEQLHAADNQPLTTSQVATVSRVFQELLTDHLVKVQARIDASKTFPKDLKEAITAAGGIANLDPRTKAKVFLKVTGDPSTKGFNLFNSNYTNFLSSIVYFGPINEKKGIGNNQIYFKGYKLVFGLNGPSIDLTNPEEINKKEVQDFLLSQNHNIKYFTKPDKANASFTEYYLDGKGNLQPRSWKNYSEYLINPTFPNGQKRTEIPVTTAIKTKEQKAAENNTDPYYTYESRAISLHVETIPTTIKKQAVQGKAKGFDIVETNGNMAELINDEVFAFYGNKTEKEEKKKPAKEPVKEPTKEPAKETTGSVMLDSVLDGLESYYSSKREDKAAPSTEEVTPAEKEPDDDIPDYSDDNDPPPSAYEGNFRVVGGGVFQTEEDLDGVIDDIKRMVPQFNVVRLKKAIQTSEGLEAWGQFIDNSIRLFEMGEKGTGYHEVFEGVANRLLTNAEWNSMYKEFGRRTGYFTDRPTGNRVKYSEATPYQAKEQMAEEFMDFKLKGVKPPSANQRTFFQMIVDFLKWLVGAQSYKKIEDIFAMVEKGKFSTRSTRSSDRFSNNFKVRILKDIPVRVKKDLYDGATSFMFQNIFYSPESLTQLDEIDLTDEKIYEPIRGQFQKQLAGAKVVASRHTDEKQKAKMNKSVEYIQYALDNWADFVSGHKESIKHLRIKFEQEDNKSDEEKSGQNRNDYLQDVFKTDGKRSASKSVRFLFHTLLKMHFNKDGKTMDIKDRTAGFTERDLSSAYMASLINYDAFMLKALDELQGLNDFSKVEEKMRDLAGITEIEEMKNPEKRAELIASLPKEKATWTALYGRLFGFSDKIDEEAAWNLRVKFSNYISKHSPEPYIFINGGGTSTIISSTKRSFFESITRKIETSLKTNSNLVFRTMKEGNLKMLVPNAEFADAKLVDGKIELSPKKLSSKDFIFRDSAQIPLGKRVDNFVKFLGLDDIITKEFIKGLSRAETSQLVDKLLVIRNAITESVVDSKSISIRNLNIFGYTSNLIEFLDRKLSISQRESQFFNIENQPQQRHIVPSFASRVIAEINNAATLSELYEKYPQTATLFARDSIIISKMFGEDGTRDTNFSISLGYMEGVKDLEEQEGGKTSRLELSDRYFLQFNASLSGLYYSLPADSETEWVLNFGEFESYSENMLKERGEEIITNTFLPKLKSEIDTIISDNTRIKQLRAKHPSATKEGAGSTIGKSLRFFKDILQYTPNGKTSSELLTDIYNAINKGQSAEQIIVDKKFKERIINAIGYYLQFQSKDTVNTLIENRLIKEEGNLFSIAGLNNSFIEKYSSSFIKEGGTILLTKEQLNSLAQYQKINTVIANMESFKILFGDPAQYKDFEKRAKSLFGPIEQSFIDSSGEFNEWLNTNKNTATLNGESVAIPDGDMFNTEFADKVKSRTIDDFEVVNVDTVNDLVAKQSEFAKRYIKEYEKTNETDGQSIGTIQFARQLLIKSGWRWTKEHENFFQYDTALMRKDMSLSGEYTYPNEELRDMDEKIIANYKDNPPLAAITPVKTLMPSIDENGNQTLLKHSIHFMSYHVAKEYELLDLYKDMLNRKDSVLNFISVQKIGAEVDNNGEITPYYTDPFTKNDLIAAGNVQQELDFKTIGIQVETQSDKKGQTLGGQLTKLSNLNLFENGVPLDFIEEGLSKSEVTKSELIEKWGRMSETDRLNTSENYRKVYGEKGTVTSLENLKVKNTMDRFNELGIKWSWNSTTGFSTSIEDLRKVKEYILSELQRLEVDQNTIDNIELTDDYKSFINPAETIPSYTTISNLLWSMADKSVTSFKVNGKPLVQVASSFFNKKSRKAAVKNEDGTWTVLNTKEEYYAAIAEGKKPVMTSSELEFYKVGADGNTVGMEVYLPDIYKKRVNEARMKRNLPALSDEELMDYLNKNPKLLEGVGFRIPTQATSSLEFFRIKGFLPEIFGNAIVVPSAITTKAGSDFDVDKLNTYLNNWKLGKDGMPVYEEYDDGNTERDAIRRYITYVNINGRKDDRNYIKALARTNKKELIQTYNTLIKEVLSIVKGERKDLYEQSYNAFKETLVDIKNMTEDEISASITALFTEGKRMFDNLSYSTKEIFWDLREQLEVRNVNGPMEIFEYLQLAEMLVDQSSGKEKALLREMITIYNLELDVFQRNRDIRKEYIEKAKAHMKNTNISIKEYYAQKLKSALDNEGFDDEIDEGLFNINFDISKEIAELSGITKFEEFSKLPIFLQNTKGALENRYFEAIRTILKAPNMFEYLLSPNSISHIRQNRDHVFNALGIQPEEGKEIDYTKFLSTEYISEKRNSFAKGKYDIGIFAIAMTNFANSQVAGIGINEEGGVKSGDSYVFDELNDGDITLPFPDLNMLNIEGKFVIPISVLKDASGALTMDKLSSYINGAVDVAKEPLIIEMGMHTELAGVYVLMERMGLTGKTTALFLYQPVVREFLKELIFLESKTYFGSSPFNFPKEIIQYLSSKYTGKFDPNFKFTDEQLAALIRKGEKVKRGEAEWTSEEKNAQYQALVNFLKLRIFGQHLLETVQGSNHDTASIRSPYIIMKKDLQVERAKTGNTVIKVTPTGIKNGAETLRSETSIGTDVQLLKDFNVLLSKMNLFALQKENPRKALENIGKRIFTQNPFIKNDDFINAMKEYESTMIDSLGNKVLVPGVKEGQVDYNQLYKYAAQYFKTDSPNSLKKRLEVLKKKYPSTFKKNFFLSNLEINTDSNLGIDTMELKDKPNNNEVVKKEMYTEAMYELAQYDEEKWPELVQFYRAVIYGAFIQFGIKYGRRSFVDLIPVSTSTNVEETRQSPLTLTDITRAALNNIENEDFSNLDEQVQRAKYYKKGIVKEEKFFTVQFIAPDPANPSEYVMENFSIWRAGESKPPNKLSQIFFGRQDEKGEMKVFIHPILASVGGTTDNPTTFEEAPNIIKVPAIKPEFLTMGERKGRLVPVPSEVVYAMMKRGNYSFMFDQLFKKVGAENSSLGRAYISKANKEGKKYISYLYKPINKTGDRSFNEILPVTTTDMGTKIGTKSILDFPPFKELEDNELVNAISDKIGRLLPVNKPQITSVKQSLKPINAAQLPDEVKASDIQTIQMTPENIIKIAKGTKTTTIRSPKQVGQIGITTGQEGIRMIGGNKYLIRNRGYLTIQQAGGLQAILKSEDIEGVELLKFQQTKDWIQGKGKLYVLDILPAPEELEQPDLLKESGKYISALSDVDKIMYESDPEGFMKYLAQQIYSTQDQNISFTPGTGLDAYPQELKDLAVKMFPKSDFISPDGKPPINPKC